MESTFWICQLADLSHSILGGSHNLVEDLLAEVWECWEEANKGWFSVYTYRAWRSWRLVASHPKRSLESVILNSGVKEDLLSDACEFLGSRKWYSERGIPFRRGYLLVSYIYVCVYSSSCCWHSLNVCLVF